MLMPPRRKVLLCSCLFAAVTALIPDWLEPQRTQQRKHRPGLTRPASTALQASAMDSLNHLETHLPRIRQVYEENKIGRRLDLDLYTTQLPASTAIRIRIAGQPARSQNSG